MKFVIFVLMVLFRLLAFAQPPNNSCNSATELCPNNTISQTNSGANKTFCPNCEDDFTFCFTANNTIWYTFTTNPIGGAVQVDFTNLVFETNPGQDNALQATILSASIPCDAASYTPLGNCVSAGNAPFSLNAAALTANTSYYIVVSGDFNGAGITSAAAATFDLTISGVGIDRIVPSVTISASSLVLCQNDIFTATATLANCPDSSAYRWYVDGVLTAVTSFPTFQSSVITDGAIISVETDCYLLCPATVAALTAPLSVYSFLVDAGPDQVTSSGQTVQLNATTTAPVYTWTPTFSMNNPNSLAPLVFPTATTVYTITATENGCTLEDYVTISIDEKLVFPTTFSPNGDGLNDMWEITGVDQFPNSFVKIYDRWGQEVYQSTGYSKEKAWDGSVKSRNVSEGVYFYIVELRDNDKQEFKGSITLIR